MAASSIIQRQSKENNEEAVGVALLTCKREEGAWEMEAETAAVNRAGGKPLWYQEQLFISRKDNECFTVRLPLQVIWLAPIASNGSAPAACRKRSMPGELGAEAVLGHPCPTPTKRMGVIWWCSVLLPLVPGSLEANLRYSTALCVSQVKAYGNTHHYSFHGAVQYYHNPLSSLCHLHSFQNQKKLETSALNV